MPIILDRNIVEDDWTVLSLIATDDPAVLAIPAGKIIVPLKVWLAQHDVLKTRANTGVWVDSNEDVAVLESDIAALPLIAINFPKFADGRGYSSAFLLRSRFGFKGQMRAIGDVLVDQMFYLHRVGFNAYAVRADKDINDALNALNDFSEVYQGSVDQPVPLFRRRAG